LTAAVREDTPPPLAVPGGTLSERRPLGDRAFQLLALVSGCWSW